MSRVPRASLRKLSDRKLSGAGSFLYNGVVDAVGYRGHGLYFDGINDTGNSVYCTTTSDYNSGCCGDDGPPYYNANYCTYYYIYWTRSIPSSSFSNAPTQGWKDGNNKGYKSIAISYGNGNAGTQLDTCANCGSPSSQGYADANGDFGACTYLGVRESDGSLWTWGINQYGQAANGTTNRSSSPTQVGSNSWRMVSAAHYHAAGIRTDGTLWCWGYGGFGELGDGTANSRSSPVQVSGGGSWIYVSCGLYKTFAIKSDYTLWSWGFNGNGQLGDGTSASRSSPVQVSGGGSWKFVAAGGDYYNGTTVAIKTNGEAYGWGYNGYGGMGDGSQNSRSSPVLVSGGYTDWTHLKSNWQGQTLGVRGNGTAWIWGYRFYGGYNGSIATNPTQIGTNTNHVSCSLSYDDNYVPRIGNNTGHHFITTGGDVTRYYDTSTANRSSAYSGGGAIALVGSGASSDAVGRAAYLVKYTNG